MTIPNTSQKVLITGCSSGFGLLTAAHLASKGHQVIATMRDLKKQGGLMDEVRSRGGMVELFAMDVTDKQMIRETISQIAAKYGSIDVLINNAGYGLGGFFEDLTDDEIRQQLETNFFGVQNMVREVVPLMRQQRRGKIINISSVAGFSASPAFGAYNASKWALEAFSESLYYELKLFGINVMLIEPGTYKTKIFYENARYAGNFHNEQSPYYPYSRHMENRVRESVDDCHKDPMDIAYLCEKLILAKNPPFRSIPDIESQVLFFLRKILPFSVYSSLLKREVFKGFGPSKTSKNLVP